MPVESMAPSLIAAVGGSALVVAMFGKLAASAASAYLATSRSKPDRLELTVDGRNFSIDLKSIGNGGSEKIEEALEAVRKANDC